MNYYKQGDAANADKIKAAFEKLGYNTGNLGFTSSNLYYTIEGKVELMCTKALQNIIKTHPDYKELELPVEPKFKVGDKIQEKHTKMYVYTVLSVDLQNQRYLVEHNYKHQLLFTSQDNFELVPKFHYDISNFKPFDKVLVKYYNDENWKCGLFSHLSTNSVAKFVCVGSTYVQCIPFDGNEHLLGTTDMPDEMYVNW